MEDRVLTPERLGAFSEYLCREEKSAATCEKYVRDVKAFALFAGTRSVTKEMVVQYKKNCEGESYAARSINSMLASINSLLTFLGWLDCKVKTLRLQQQVYCPEEKELTKGEYLRLLEAAGKDERLKLILQTICGTGIRVSELRYFTVEAVRQGEVAVNCKSKTRRVFVPARLKKSLLDYAKRKKITAGVIFLGKNGKAMDRSSIWRQMKGLCKKADVKPSKVYPHNLRKLFARTFYGMEKDIAKLADLLGHSSVNTTRIYIVTTGAEHRAKIERMGLVL